jgi:hypothetical protein
MVKNPRNIYELMSWAAEQHDLDPSQRKELYEWLESEDILKTAKDPNKEASKYAKELKKAAEMLKKRRKGSAAVGDRATATGARKKGKDDLDEMSDDAVSDTFDSGPESQNWYDDDMDRSDYPDYNGGDE